MRENLWLVGLRMDSEFGRSRRSAIGSDDASDIIESPRCCRDQRSRHIETPLEISASIFRSFNFLLKYQP